MIPVATIFPTTDEHLIQLLTYRLMVHTKRPYSKAYLNDSSEDRIQNWCSETGIRGKSWNEKCGPRPRYARGKSKYNCRGYHRIPTRPKISDCV